MWNVEGCLRTRFIYLQIQDKCNTFSNTVIHQLKCMLEGILYLRGDSQVCSSDQYRKSLTVTMNKNSMNCQGNFKEALKQKIVPEKSKSKV